MRSDPLGDGYLESAKVSRMVACQRAARTISTNPLLFRGLPQVLPGPAARQGHTLPPPSFSRFDSLEATGPPIRKRFVVGDGATR